MKAFHLLFSTILLFLLPSFLQAQVPQQIPYRAMLKMNGNVISNQTIDMRFSILESGTTAVYQETQTLTTNAVGLVSSAIGGGNTTSGIFSSIAWDQGDYSLQVEMDNNGGWLNLGITPLQTVPFAFHAQTVANDSSNSYEIGLNGNELILLENGSPTDSLDLSTIGITNGDTASGDLGQFYPNPEVWGLAGNPISSSVNTPLDGNILKWNSTNGQWVLSVDQVGSPGPTTNTVFPLIGDGSPVAPVTLGQNGASTGQVLKWNGVFWEALNDSINTYLQGPGINISGPVISNTGDLDPNDDVTFGSVAGGDLGGTYPNPVVSGLRGGAISPTVPQNGEVLQWNTTTQMWEPSFVSVGGFVNTSSPLIGGGSSIAPITLGQNGASTGQVLKWNGVFWEALNDSINTYLQGPGININGPVISNTGDLDPSNDVTIGSTAGGDLGGTYPNPTVVGIQGIPVSPNTTLQGNDILKFIAGQWAYVHDETMDADADPLNEIQSLSQNGNLLSLSNGGGTVTLFTAGQGISVSGNQISSTGDTNALDDITIGTPAGGDLSGVYPNPSVSRLHGWPISTSAPQTGEVLKWDGTQWEANTDNSPWTQSGNDLSYSTGDVGIGTASPASELSVGGTATVLNASGSVRVEAGTGTNDGGFVRIMDTNDQILAGMFINALGEGDLFADTKNFRVDHPTEPDKDIWYASLEGPEAAAYVRGTATLQDGKVVVDLPDHFELIAASEGMTVMLTPLSAESKGLAVIQKDVRQFEVQELLQGQGNYSFDWEVKAVRKGHEDFQVIRPALSPRK